MSKRAVISTRVSTDDQATWGYSLQTQLEACRAYCAAHDLTIVAELTDDCSGSVPVMERPGGRKLYELVDRGAVDVVVMYTLDRTARDEKVIEYLLFKSYLFDRGVELHYTDTGLDAYTMEGNLVGYIKAHGAADERKKIRERTQRGKQAKAAAGRWVGLGVPFGYRKVGERREAVLEIDEAEAEIVRRIFAMYLGKDGYRPKNMRGISMALMAEKVPVSGRGRKNARGWTDGTIRYILTNPAYMGDFRNMGQTICLPDLAIISRDDFKAAQKRRADNARRAKRNRKHEYLLAGGFLRCVCGNTMIARMSKSDDPRRRYYSCNTYGRRYLYSCREGRYIRADLADALVWEWVLSLLDDENLERGIKKMIAERDLELSPKRARLETVIQLLDQASRQIKRLAETLADADNDEVASALKVELKRLGHHQSELAEERARLEVEMGQGDFCPEEIEEIRHKLDEVRESLVDVDFETKRLVLAKFNLQARALPGDGGPPRIEVTCSLSTKPEVMSIVTKSLEDGKIRQEKERPP
jgi:site-specific DNA recombinase